MKCIQVRDSCKIKSETKVKILEDSEETEDAKRASKVSFSIEILISLLLPFD